MDFNKEQGKKKCARRIYREQSVGALPSYFFGVMSLDSWDWLSAFPAEFILDEKGAFYRTELKQAKKNRIVNSLAVILGLLTGKFTAACAGLLADQDRRCFCGGTA